MLPPLVVTPESALYQAVNPEVTGRDALMVSVRLSVPVPPVLTALRAMVAVPVAVGVPEMTPVVVLILKPLGSPVAL